MGEEGPCFWMEKKPYVYFHSHPTKCLHFPLLRRQTKNDNSIRLTVINRNHRWNTVILTTNSKTEILINNTNFYLSLLQIHYYTGDFKIFCWLWRRQWHPTPVLLPGKSHGRRSLVGAVHGVAKSRTRLSDFPFTFQFPALEKEMTTHSSVLAWRIPGTGKPGGLPSMGSHRVGHDWSDLA